MLSFAFLLTLNVSTAAENYRRSALDTLVMGTVQADILEQLQADIDARETIELSRSFVFETGKQRIATDCYIEEETTVSGRTLYHVRLVSRIGGTASRKLTNDVILTQQKGAMYS
jgi:hypothetical protein